MSDARWSIEQVLAIAPSRAGAARPLAVPALWSDTGCDERAVWGRHTGGRAEPYVVLVDHSPAAGDLATRCTCPSRVRPCKHAIALLLLWARGDVVGAAPPETVSRWIESRPASAHAQTSRSTPSGSDERRAADRAPAPEVTPRSGETPNVEAVVRDERRRRLEAGLAELERWIDDRFRMGWADPSVAGYAVWDDLAARLVDAQAGGLANRVRRIAGQVGMGPDWHAHVVAEMGVLHVLARAGRRLGLLDRHWRDGVAAAIGLTVRQADVRAQVPETATWAVMGMSDTVEDRIVVRRTWLRSLDGHVDEPHDGWALVLSFAAHGQALESPADVGSVFTADLHRYPGTVALRALIGPVHDHARGLLATANVVPASPSIAAARAGIGAMLADEPWLERVPFCVAAAPTIVAGEWVLADHSGALPLLDIGDLPTLLAASEGRPVVITGEWTPLGVVPLTVHLGDRTLAVGGRRGLVESAR